VAAAITVAMVGTACGGGTGPAQPGVPLGALLVLPRIDSTFAPAPAATSTGGFDGRSAVADISANGLTLVQNGVTNAGVTTVPMRST